MTKLLKRHSDGWSARYQVYSLMDSQEPVYDTRYHLDSTKVWTQIRQSLWKDGKGTAADTCRLQFPIRISTSLQRFSILGDIYTTQHHSEGKATCHISALALDFNGFVEDAWDSGLLEEECHVESSSSKPMSLDSWTHRNCRLYLYWIWLSMDGRFAFFIDKAPSGPSNMAIFDLGKTDPVTTPLLLNHLTYSLYGGLKDVYCDAASFHPSHSLVAFTIVGIVYLWAYEHGNAPCHL